MHSVSAVEDGELEGLGLGLLVDGVGVGLADDGVGVGLADDGLVVGFADDGAGVGLAGARRPRSGWLPGWSCSLTRL